MSALLDASAILAFLQDESGADVVEAYLERGALCSAVNWSEVAQKVVARGGDWDVVAALLSTYGLRLIDADQDDAVAAARLGAPGSGLSLGDRFCLATAARREVQVVTADTAWGTGDGIVQIR